VPLVGQRNGRGDSGNIANDARCVALAGQILCEVDVTRSEAVHTSIAEPNLDFAAQGDDELAAWRRMPVDEVARLSAAEDNADRVLQAGKLRMRVEVHRLEVSLTIGAGVQTTNVHCRSIEHTELDGQPSAAATVDKLQLRVERNKIV
jgi:hypothetical protein